MSTNHDNDQDTYLTRFAKSPFFIASFTLVAVFCGLLVQWSVEFIEPKFLIYGAISSGVVMMLIITTTVILNKLKSQESLDSKVSDLSKLIVNNNMHWMVNQQYIQMVETQSDECWTFAPELTYALQPDSDIFKGASQNMARGARYKFFMPDRPRVHKIVADYKRLYKFKPGQVEFILIPHSEFIFHTLISLYNVKTSRPRAIEWLPVRALNVWVEMDEEHSNRMVGIGEILIRKYADRYVSGEDNTQKATVVNDG